MSVDQFEEAKEASQKWNTMSEKAKVGAKLKLRLSGIKPAKDRVRIDKGAVMIVHVLSGWPASSYPIRRAFLQHTSLRVSVRSNLSLINERVVAISPEGMARLLYGCLFILHIRQWYWTWKAFLSIKNYFYQHQNITIIIKGECETCPISEIALIILSLTFIGSFEAAAFSF